MSRNYFYLMLLLNIFMTSTHLSAEPFIVLQYNNVSELSDRSNEFAQNPDYSDNHMI